MDYRIPHWVHHWDDSKNTSLNIADVADSLAIKCEQVGIAAVIVTATEELAQVVQRYGNIHVVLNWNDIGDVPEVELDALTPDFQGIKDLQAFGSTLNKRNYIKFYKLIGHT